MNVRRLVVMMLLALPMAMIVSGSASAQYGNPYANPAGESIAPHVVEVPFPFEAGTKTLPPGRYDIEQPSRELLTFRSAKGIVAEIPIITRLAKASTPVAEAKVVFDKAGDKYYISEIWIPGADGFLVGATREVHTHETVKAITKK
jgi:hypothetical protein